MIYNNNKFNNSYNVAGSCWAFSAVGAVEGSFKDQVATFEVPSLSAQQLVDCETEESFGCEGGSVLDAYQYMKTLYSCTEESYPYKRKQEFCLSQECTPLTRVRDYYKIMKPHCWNTSDTNPFQQSSVLMQMTFHNTREEFTKGNVIPKLSMQLILIVGYATHHHHQKTFRSSSSIRKTHKKWMTKYNRTYSSEVEYQKHL